MSYQDGKREADLPGKRVWMNARLPVQLAKFVRVKAIMSEITKTEVIEAALKEYFGRKTPELSQRSKRFRQ